MATNLSEAFSRSPFLLSLRQSLYSLPVRPEFLASSSFKFVNPRSHVTNTDKVVQVLPASAIAGLSDENVLALFSTGFFGGFIFGFERFILRIGGYNILPSRYTGFERPSDAVTIWNKSDIPTTHLLPNGSNLFGSFTMLDKYIATNPSEQDASYVDYGFGSDESIFAGCHRFQITRLPTQSGAESQVQMELLHFRCNPQKNKPSIAEYIERFHYVYAKALFANGIQYVITR
ncbi:hypothetical protein TSTA_004030 [Talaromyces stipitatus ATCC 10500]|uniref:Uncharacterized protein n=1 Tax=Talaromyces stipitatus (strain ATCC 10500 / CBS 375.48 / QM 6759 / NRRL 1006) TaxID=441959 RepID=B8MSM3_TALSN|nr:uncharacterized protein TSTA_004030 [Talaromyces stipitatus ATCC 10500]EED12351.1 hypothetical protein TSTA_004030 [Talaromyces stipitatus ATCC 10500]